MARKILSLIVALTLVLAIMPRAAFARSTQAEADPDLITIDKTVPLSGSVGEVSGMTGERAGEPEKGQTIVREFDFEYSAESQFAQEWQLIDADGDGYKWQWFGYGINYNTGSGDTAPNFAAQGIGYMASCSYWNPTDTPLTPNNWAVSPAVTLNGGNPYVR